MKASKPINTSHTIKKFVLRLPADIHEKILLAAKQNRRSMNAEIIHCLDQAPSIIPIQTPLLSEHEKRPNEQYLLQILQSLPIEQCSAILTLLTGNSHVNID